MNYNKILTYMHHDMALELDKHYNNLPSGSEENLLKKKTKYFSMEKMEDDWLQNLAFWNARCSHSIPSHLWLCLHEIYDEAFFVI